MNLQPPILEIYEIRRALAHSLLHAGWTVKPDKWQGIAGPPMFEATNISFTSEIPSNQKDLAEYLKPNLPWAEDHFLERVGGFPLNPGKQYANWPYYRNPTGKAVDVHRLVPGGRFTHTYMERMWPSHAGVDGPEGCTADGVPVACYRNRGIRYQLGDLDDLVNLLRRDRLTRQAYLPIWFPEDTGATHGGRVPCSLGYHFLNRNNKLSCTYGIRSCDLIRHAIDDVYLAMRLTQWVADKVGVTPDHLTMHIASLHVFQPEIGVIEKW